MNQYFSDLLNGARSLIEGFGVTLKALLSPPVTVQYPRETIPVSAGYRGHIELIIDEESGSHRCISCGTCARTCPSRCIEVKGEKPEGGKRKELARFQLDFTRCSLCGTCVEVCPVTALRFSRVYGQAGYTREEFMIDVLKRAGVQK